MPRKPTKKTNHPSPVKWVSIKPLPTFFLSLVLLGILWIPASYLLRQYNFQQNKDKIHSSLTNIQNWFNPPGELVYNKLSDDGCGRDPSSWLGIYKACSYTLYKVYKGAGDAEPSLRKALGLMADKGWIRQAYLDSSDFGTVGSCEVIYTNRWGGACTYGLRDVTKPAIELNFFPRDDPRYKDETPKQFFGIDQDIALSSNEYLYGVRVVGMYRE